VSPFAFGVFTPTIYIPQRLLATADTTSLYAIMAHEINHIKRHDVLWMSLQNLLQIIYFFFPVAWYANHQVELARECICDRDAVTTGKISTAQYGASLLTVLKLSFRQEPLQFLPSFNAQYHNLKTRIQRLKAYSQQKKPHRTAMCASLLVFGLLTLPMAPERIKIRFFSPFDEAERHVFQTIQQRVVKPYAEAYSRTMATMQYTGIGLQAEFGEPVYAIGKGEVVRIAGEAPYTEVVVAHKIQRHTTVFSVYARITDVSVHIDDEVTEHTPIGRLLTREEYNKSQLTEQHLHLEVRTTLDAYRSRSPHYFKYQTPETLDAGFLNPLTFYHKHLES
jgi:murein DD-endopeptidase MepM/ murein hydrolase activator NlpD